MLQPCICIVIMLQPCICVHTYILTLTDSAHLTCSSASPVVSLAALFSRA